MNSERKLIEHAKNKDKQAMEVLYLAHFDNLYRFVRHMVDTNERAEDICSESFVKAFNGLHRFEGKSSFKTWLFTIARNQVFDWYKKKGTETNLVYDPPSDDGCDTPKSDGSADLGPVIKQILSKLPRNYRQVLELRFLGGCSVKETAQIMGITLNNAKVLQNRAIKKAQTIVNNN